MKTWSHVILVNLALTAVGLRVWLDPWPALGEVPLLDLVHATDPLMYAIFPAVHIATPGFAVLIVSVVTLSIWRIWLAPRIQSDEAAGQGGSLPPWPTTPEDESLSLVVGEVHHPNEIRQVSRPQWLVIPERGLYTGIAI